MDLPGNLLAAANKCSPDFNGLGTRHRNLNSIAISGFLTSYHGPKNHVMLPLIVHRKNKLNILQLTSKMTSEILICHWNTPFVKGLHCIPGLMDSGRNGAGVAS